MSESAFGIEHGIEISKALNNSPLKAMMKPKTPMASPAGRQAASPALKQAQKPMTPTGMSRTLGQGVQAQSRSAATILNNRPPRTSSVNAQRSTPPSRRP